MNGSARVVLNGFPKGGTNLVATVLDLLGLKQQRGVIASSLVLGRYTFVRRLLWGVTKPQNSVIVGVDFPVAVRETKVKRMVLGIKPGTYITAHCGYTDHLHSILTSGNTKVIQIIRDPRDIVVSHASYCASHEEHPLFPHYVNLSAEQRLMFSISGGRTTQGYFLESIGQRARSVDGWVRSKDVLTVHFEDLVGSKGGGSEAQQERTVRDIAHFLGLDMSRDAVREICGAIWGAEGRTFRKGQIGNWQAVFTPDMLTAYHASAYEITRTWGYDVGA